MTRKVIGHLRARGVCTGTQDKLDDGNHKICKRTEMNRHCNETREAVRIIIILMTAGRHGFLGFA